VRIVIDVLYPEPEIPPIPTPKDITMALYTNPHYAVTFKYPSHWTVNPTFSTPEYGYTSYHGDDGFYIITAAGGGSLDAYTASEANHKLKPYGSTPTISNLTIQGQAARLIMPSEDQSMSEQAGLIVEYPYPVTIGEHTYPFFVMYADKDWIDCMSSTIIFEPIQ
jgi:TolB protein